MKFLSPAHDLKIVLMQPQIAPNTGNIARLCVASGAELHLVRPLGFVLSDHYLKRSAMDYWERVKLTVHDDCDAFFKAADSSKLHLFSSKASHGLWETTFHPGEYLVFGSETRGIDASILEAHLDRLVRIPQVQDERCLNLSTAAGIAFVRGNPPDWLRSKAVVRPCRCSGYFPDIPLPGDWRSAASAFTIMLQSKRIGVME